MASAPPLALLVWGKNDVIFPETGAHPCKRDLTDLEFHILDTGHFALEEFGPFIAQRMLAPDLEVHLIADTYATHKHPKVKAWLARHRRFQMHFTPTSASWLNLVERFFAEITRKRIRRGVFRSVVELQAAIKDYLDHHNTDPKPFVWTASASSIIEKVNRGKQALEPQR